MQTGDSETIRVEHPTEMVGHIVLNRPDRLNTVSPEMLEEFATAIETFEEDENIRSLLITGAGDRAFSAGADAVSLASNPDDVIETLRRGQQVWGRLEEVGMPVVAGIDGYCFGGGMELAMCADMRIATERSEFGLPEFDLGIIPGWGGTQRLRHIVGEGRLREMIFTADHYDAETMAEYGFLNEVVDNDALDAAAVELADDLAHGPPLAMEYAKEAILVGREDSEAGLEAEISAYSHLITTEDAMEGVMKIQTDEDPEFEGK